MRMLVWCCRQAAAAAGFTDPTGWLFHPGFGYVVGEKLCSNGCCCGKGAVKINFAK